MACGATDALMVPLVLVEEALVHSSLRAYGARLPMPRASVLAEIVAVEPVSLVRESARSPFASSLAITTRPPEPETTVPCLPRLSWSRAMTSGLDRMSKVSAVALRRSLPISSGADIIDQRVKCVRYSAAVIPPLPTSSMSGSFHRPGPAYGASGWFLCAIPIIEDQLSPMSPVVRHRWPRSDAQVHGWFSPHSHSEKTMGRPVLFRASAMSVYRFFASTPWLLQLSYLR